MCQAAYQIINPGVEIYCTVAGVDGFDGRVKKRQKQWLKHLTI
jgi:hypothetical protein